MVCALSAGDEGRARAAGRRRSRRRRPAARHDAGRSGDLRLFDFAAHHRQCRRRDVQSRRRPFRRTGRRRPHRRQRLLRSGLDDTECSAGHRAARIAAAAEVPAGRLRTGPGQKSQNCAVTLAPRRNRWLKCGCISRISPEGPMAIGSQPVMLQTAEPMADADVRPVRRPEPKFGIAAVVFAIILSAFWIGATGAFLWGYLQPRGLSGIDTQALALFIAATFLPPLLFIAAAWAMARAQQMAVASHALADATDRLFSADETASRTAARLGRAVRRELDALNAGQLGATFH